MIGQTIGNFEVVSHLGIGGMGEVWLAEQRSVGTRVAIKLMNAAVTKNTQLVQRFVNEARAVSRIQHAGIVKIFDVGEHEGHAYLIMEYLEGETLSQRLARVGRLSFAEIADIGRQIANVLDATHSAGITHRDLKPDNVFLVPDREVGERVKILDFGIAKFSGTLADVSPQTMGTLGTPAYMAPEQWGDSSKVDWRADLYSLGCLVFEMTCGRPPFVAESIAEACGKHLNEPPPHASSLTPTVPPALEQLLSRLLAKDPVARGTSMREVARAFELVDKQALGDAPTLLVDAVSLSTPAMEPPRRSLSMMAISLAGVILVVGGVVAVYVVRNDDPRRNIVQSNEAARVAAPPTDRVSAGLRGSQSEVSAPSTSTAPSPSTSPAGVRDAPPAAPGRTLATGKSAAAPATTAVPQPVTAGSTPTVPPPSTPPATSRVVQPASTPAIPPQTPAAAQTEKPASARSANAPATSTLIVDARAKDAGAPPATSSKPEPPESAAGSGDKTGSGADREALHQAVRARSAQMNRCYEIALRDDASLSGTVTLRIKVDSNGRVIEADADGLTETVQTCLIMLVREIKFPKPAAVVSLTIPFRFEHE